MKRLIIADIFSALGVLITPFFFNGTVASYVILIFLMWLVGRVVLLNR